MFKSTQPTKLPKLPRNFTDTFLQENGIELESDRAGFGLVPANDAAKNVVNGMKQEQKKRGLFGG